MVFSFSLDFIRFLMRFLFIAEKLCFYLDFDSHFVLLYRLILRRINKYLFACVNDCRYVLTRKSIRAKIRVPHNLIFL